VSQHAAMMGKSAPAVLNAANEVAVEAFLSGRIGFNTISQVVEHCMNNSLFYEPDTIEAVQDTDQRARYLANEYIIGIN
jgi:1-deoxy-D-xylulose-5-phosphate reductoisomerase